MKESIRLTRKYRITKHLKEHYNSVSGSRFQIANKENFSDSLTIATIDSLNGFHFQTLDIDHNKQCKYFRFLIPDNKNAEMAEIEI